MGVFASSTSRAKTIMGEGDDEKGDLPKLRKREDFHGWKEKMLLYSMEKGDTEGIFSDTGNDPTIGYQALPAGALGNNRRLEWAKLSNKLTGLVGPWLLALTPPLKHKGIDRIAGLTRLPRRRRS